MTRDPLTLKHVGNGAPINGSPTRFGADGTNNSEVHGTGEVWTTMLWECYASLLRDTLGDKPRFTFEQAQQRMKEYLVASLRATPVNPTFLEARDANGAFVRVDNVSRGQPSGSQWAWDLCDLPYAHGAQPSRLKPCP